MKRRLVLGLISLFLVMYGCGGGSGGLIGEGDKIPQPGGNCAYINGSYICLKSFEPFYYDYEKYKNANVDIFRSICEDTSTSGGGDGNSTTTRPEYFGDHSFMLEIETRGMTGYRQVPDFLIYPVSYTIDYIVSPDSFEAPAIEKYYGGLPSVSLRSSVEDSSVKVSGVFFDVARKIKAYQDLQTMRHGNPAIPSNYVAYVKFNMQTSDGKKFELSTVVGLSIGNYDYCAIGKETEG